ncbi:unnamed protein product, partial [Phaeothamnion confervicola]
MLGWIKKKSLSAKDQTNDGASSAGSPRGRSGSRGPGSPGFDAGKGRPLQALLGTRGGRRRREDDGGGGGSGAGGAALDGELAARAERILHAAFKLVREIQRVLKAARETQQAEPSRDHR